MLLLRVYLYPWRYLFHFLGVRYGGITPKGQTSRDSHRGKCKTATASARVTSPKVPTRALPKENTLAHFRQIAFSAFPITSDSYLKDTAKYLDLKKPCYVCRAKYATASFSSAESGGRLPSPGPVASAGIALRIALGIMNRPKRWENGGEHLPFSQRPR